MTPDFLYHYTSIEILALILKTHGIRFNSLNNVDDLNEGQCKDYKHIGKYFFISCWTNLDDESLPFWNMYTPKMKGVRIKMPSDLFKKYKVSTDGIPSLACGLFDSVVPHGVSFFPNYWIVPTQNDFLKRVEYTDDTNKLYPNIYTVKDSNFTVDLGKIGKYKTKHWFFQSEWRFILKIFPLTTQAPTVGKGIKEDILSNSLASIKSGDEIPFRYYDVEIDSEKMKEMEILLGPKVTNSERIIVESLVNTLNPTAKILISELHGKIK